MPIILFKDNVVFYKPHDIYDEEKGIFINKGSWIEVVKKSVIEKYYIKDFSSNFAFTYQDKFYVLGNNEVLKVFDENFYYTNDIFLSDRNNNIRAIRDVKFIDGKLYIAFLLEDSNIEICEYDIEGNLIDMKGLKVKEAWKWNIEAFSFYPVAKRTHE
ncbi:MAG: hypothetical protein ACOYIF_08495 [Acetivibrionales bacterium]